MSLKRILDFVAPKIGMNPAVAGERSVLLRFVNEAADEVYRQADLVGTQMEQVFQVNGDQTVTLPYYIGPIRAIRELNTHIAWDVNRLRPRYNQYSWGDEWRNYRLRGRQALEKSITNEGPLTIVVNSAQPSVTVSITGSTLTASQITEVVTLAGTEQSTTNNFITIDVITKSAITTCDVFVKDPDDVTLAIIPNHMLASSYQCVDVSMYPWSNAPTDRESHYVEILYKKALPVLTEDNDEFPAQGYDYVIANKCMQLWCEDQGKIEEALAWDGKATRTMARIQEDENGATQDKVSLVAHPHDSLFEKIRPTRNRQGGYILGL